MCTREARATLTAVAVALALAGCAAPAVTRVPPGWLPDPDTAREHVDGYGAWASVRHHEGIRGQRLEGEWANVRYQEAFQGELMEGELIASDPDSTWVLDGDRLVACSTRAIVNVHLLLARDPGGRTDGLLVGRGDWSRLRAWARFPQGIPPGLERAAIRPKPTAPSHR